MDIKVLIRKMIVQYFWVLSGTMIAIIIYCTIKMPETVFTIKFMWQILGLCLLSECPMFVFYSRKELRKRQWYMRELLHTVLLELVLLIAGKKMGMYQGLFDGILFAAIIFIVNVFVKIMNYTRDWRVADKINRQLQNCRRGYNECQRPHEEHWKHGC